MAIQKNVEVEDIGDIQITIKFTQKIGSNNIFKFDAFCEAHKFFHSQEHRQANRKDIDPLVLESFEKKVTAMLKQHMKKQDYKKAGYVGEL